MIVVQVGKRARFGFRERITIKFTIILRSRSRGRVRVRCQDMVRIKLSASDFLIHHRIGFVSLAVSGNVITSTRRLRAFTSSSVGFGGGGRSGLSGCIFGESFARALDVTQQTGSELL